MVARRLAVFIHDAPDDEFRDRLSAAAPSAPARIVISLDSVVRELLRQISPQIADLREILWADPSRDVAEWFRRGARTEKKRKLGNR